MTSRGRAESNPGGSPEEWTRELSRTANFSGETQGSEIWHQMRGPDRRPTVDPDVPQWEQGRLSGTLTPHVDDMDPESLTPHQWLNRSDVFWHSSSSDGTSTKKRGTGDVADLSKREGEFHAGTLASAKDRRGTGNYHPLRVTQQSEVEQVSDALANKLGARMWGGGRDTSDYDEDIMAEADIGDDAVQERIEEWNGPLGNEYDAFENDDFKLVSDHPDYEEARDELADDYVTDAEPGNIGAISYINSVEDKGSLSVVGDAQFDFATMNEDLGFSGPTYAFSNRRGKPSPAYQPNLVARDADTNTWYSGEKAAPVFGDTVTQSLARTKESAALDRETGEDVFGGKQGETDQFDARKHAPAGVYREAVERYANGVAAGGVGSISNRPFRRVPKK